MKIKAELLQLEKRVDSLRAREDDAALQRSRAVAQAELARTDCHVPRVQYAPGTLCVVVA